MVLFLSKLYLPRIQRGSIIFQGVSNFFQGGGGGVQMLIFLETHIRTFFRGGGGVRTPFPLLDPHMCNDIITGQYLSQSRF